MRRREHAIPQVDLKAGIAELTDGRHFRQPVGTRARAGRERPQLAGPQQPLRRRIVDKGGIDMRAVDRLDFGERAGERHERHFEVGAMHEHLVGDLRQCPDAGAERQAAGLVARGGDEFAQRMIGRRAVDDDHGRCRADAADRLQAGQGVEIKLPQVRREQERIVGDKQRIAVRDGAHGVLRADHGTGSRAVLNHQRRAAQVADFVDQHAREHVGAATWRIRVDEFDGTRGLRPRSGYRKEQ